MNIKKVLSIVQGNRHLGNNGSVHYSGIVCIGQQHHSLCGSASRFRHRQMDGHESLEYQCRRITAVETQDGRIDRYQLKHGQKSSNGLPFNADIKI